MAARIPEPLRPPTKPPTVAEMKRMREPPPAPLTPEQQAQIAEYQTQLAQHEKSISDVRTQLEKSQAELALMQKQYREYTQVKSAKFITLYLTRESGKRKEIETLQQMIGQLEQGYLIKSQEAIGYAKAVGETTRREAAREEIVIRPIRKEIQELKKAREDIIKKFGTTLTFKEAIQLTPIQRKALGITQKEIGQLAPKYAPPYAPPIEKAPPTLEITREGIYLPDIGVGYKVVPTKEPIEITPREIAIPELGTVWTRPEYRREIVAPPKIPEKPIYKKVWHTMADVYAGAVAYPYTYLGVWGEHVTRPTAWTAEEIEAEKKRLRELVPPPIVGIGGMFGIGAPPLAFERFKVGSIAAAMEMRRAGEEVLFTQEQLIKESDPVFKNIDKIDKEFRQELTGEEKIAIAFGADIGEIYKEKAKTAYELRVKKFNKEVTEIEKEIERVGIENISEKTRKKLDDLIVQEQILNAEYKLYDEKMSIEINKLKAMGFKVKISEEGIMNFKHPILEKKVAPVAIKLHQKFLDETGKATWRNYVLSGTYAAQKTAEMVAVGAGLGLTGLPAWAAGKIAALPTAARVGISVGMGIPLGVGAGLRIVRQYKVGDPFGVGKIAAVTAGVTTAGQVTGFVFGAKLGTAAYYRRIEERLLAGRYMEEPAIRKGILYKYKEATIAGRARQIGIRETRIKGTPYRIKTWIGIKGKYAAKIGKSKIEIRTMWVGKKPPGVQKYYYTRGEALEADRWVRARLYTKSPKAKFWTKQDVFIRRDILSREVFDLKDIVYPKGEILKYTHLIRLHGTPVKIKTPPKEIWTEAELFRFRFWKPERAVVEPWKWAEARPLEIAATKQIVLYGTPKGVKIYDKSGMYIKDLTKTEFESMAYSKGAANKLWKELLSKGVIAIKQNQLALFRSKGGRLLLTTPKPATVPKPTVDITAPPKTTLTISERGLISAHYQQFVPGIISDYHQMISPFIAPVSAGALGSLAAFDTRQVSQIKQDVKTREIQLIVPKEVPVVVTKEEAALTQPVAQIAGLVQQSITKQRLIPKQAVRLITPITPTVPTPTPTPLIPPIIPFWFPGEPYRKIMRTGYHTFVKSKGKYQKVTTAPMTMEGAKDVGARITDNTVSAMFKIEPIKKTKIMKGKRQMILKKFKEEELGKGDDYFKRFAHKFRSFMIRRGQKLEMQNKWIEKRGKRSDTPGEKEGLTVAAFRARERKRRMGLPVRKTKRKAPKDVKGFFGMR